MIRITTILPVRVATLPASMYAGDGVGIASPTQGIMLTNTGSSAITVASLGLTGPLITAMALDFGVSVATASRTQVIKDPFPSGGGREGVYNQENHSGHRDAEPAIDVL